MLKATKIFTFTKIRLIYVIFQVYKREFCLILYVTKILCTLFLAVTNKSVVNNMC